MSDETQIENGNTAPVVIDFQSMPIAKLRQYAALYGVQIARDNTKEEIIAAIEAKKRNKDFAQIVETDATCPAGWAKIIVQRDPTPGARNGAFIVNNNGYRAAVPRGVPVLVPIKIVETLKDAVEYKLEEDYLEPLNSKQRFKFVPSPAYPFQVLEMTPGPDPRPSERQRQAVARWGPRAEFRAVFDHWPSKQELADAIKEGFISSIKAPTKRGT